MSKSNGENSATLPPSGPEELLRLQELGEGKKEKTVRTRWARFVRQLKARLRPDDRIYLGEAIEDIHEAAGMLEDLSSVIKVELAYLKSKPSEIEKLLMSESPEQRELIMKLDALRLKAWSLEVQSALCSARVTLKIAERMEHENQTDASYNWGADDLEIYGEIGEIRRRLPTKSHFSLIDTDRAYEELTDGRLTAEPRRGLFMEGCGRR